MYLGWADSDSGAGAGVDVAANERAALVHVFVFDSVKV